MKIGCHIKISFGEFQESDGFQHEHLSIVGPLPPSHRKENNLGLTIIDRATEWPEEVKRERKR